MKKTYLISKAFGLIALVSFLFSGNSLAQVSLYGFQESSGTYAALAGGTNSTAIGDDGTQNAIPIGFTFNFGGVNYTQFGISTNGWIKLGNAGMTFTGSHWFNQLNPTVTDQEPVVGVMWEDGNRNTGSISYLTTGSAPNRVLEVNWNGVNVGGIGATSGTNTCSYLVRLYETSNNVEMIYGTMVAAGTLNASIGLTDLTTYKSVTPGAPATVSSSTPNDLIASLTDVTGKRYLFTGPPVSPELTQDPTPPTCSGGTSITAIGTPDPGVTWYWQTTPTGTSTATAYSGPNTVFANGTFYLRAFDANTTLWALNSSTIVISNFPLAAVPNPPVAATNPACVTSGTTISADTPPSGTVYYWQGTTANGTSNALDASTPFNVTTTGTYHLAAYETASQCWSNTSSVFVTVDTYIPAAPTATPSVYNICSMTPSLEISATPPPGGSGGTASATSGAISVAIPDATTVGVSSILNISGIPADATVTAVSVTVNITHTFDGDIDMFLIGPNGTQIELSTDNGGLDDNYVNTVFTNTASTSITAGVAPFTGSFLPEGNLTASFSIPNGNWSLFLQDDAGGDLGTLTNWSIAVTYTQNPVSTLAWYDAATGGNNIGNGAPFETVGTTVMPNTNSEGSHIFYAGSVSGGCVSTTTTAITVNITEVLAQLNPVNVTCNGGNNGSFTLGTISCGDAGGDFLYSVNSGAFGPIPTNLVAGTYSVVIQDQTNMGESAPISVVITEPAAPSALNATDVTYYNATLEWTTPGDETSWTVIWGETGFDPSTEGNVEAGVTNPYTITGELEPSTSYDFYVFADCGALADTSGPFTFVTNNGFNTWDTQCGPGFIPIHTTGTALNLLDDGAAIITLTSPISYQGESSTSVEVNNNGYILFGDAGLAPWNVDLDDEYGNVYWQEMTIGGDDYLVVEWYNRPKWSSIAGQTVTFEVAVNKTTGETYFLYDDKVFGGTQSSYDFGGNTGLIAAFGPQEDVVISDASQTFLQNNSCVRLYYSLCPNITNFTSSIYPDEASFSWDAGAYGETEWTVVWGEPGFDPQVSGEEIGTEVITTDEIQIFDLIQNTEYDIYIYSECSADNITSDGFFFNFTTLPYCSTPTTFAGTTDVDSLELTWNWTEYISGGTEVYDIDQFNVVYTMNGVYTGNAVADGTNNADTIFDPELIGSGVYQVYLQADCGNNDTSAWAGPITVRMPLSNDTVCGAEMLEMDLAYTFNNAGATVSLDEVNIAPPANGAQVTNGWANSTLNNTVWYSFVAPESGSVRINNTAIEYNGQLAVYDVANCGNFNSNFNLVAANDNAIGGTSLAPNFTVCGLNPGDIYYILHDGTGTTGNYSISISEIVLDAGSALATTQICYGEILDLNTTIEDNDLGGVWSASVAAVNASISGSTFNSNGLASQTFDFQYRMTDGCAYDSIISQVQIVSPANPGTDGSVSICKNEPINLFDGLSGTVDLGGQWYDPSEDPTSADVVGSPFPGSFVYDYVAGNGVCPNDTSHVVITVLSTCDYLSLEEAAFSGVQLYPNPTSGIINIDADNVFNVEVTDANGRMIKKNISTNVGTTSIDLGKVQVGVYFVTLRTEESAKVYRVVVQ